MVGMARRLGRQVNALVLRRRLLDLIRGETTLADFDEWFTRSTWDESDVAPDARELVGKIGLLIGEYSSDVWTWPQLKARLEMAATSASFVWGDAPAPHVFTGSTSSLISELRLAM